LGGSAVFVWFTIDQTLEQWRVDQAQLGMDIVALALRQQDSAAGARIEAAQARVRAGFKRMRADVFERVLASAQLADSPLDGFSPGNGSGPRRWAEDSVDSHRRDETTN
jgi:hypothetical protein